MAGIFDYQLLYPKIGYAFVLYVVFIVALLIFCNDADAHFKCIHYADDMTLIDKVYNRAYFGILLATTNGYDDMRPKSRRCGIIVSVFLGTLFLGLMNIIGPK